MKWNSLNRSDQRRLQDEYDRRHAEDVPEKPVFNEPQQSARMTVDTGNDTHIYAFMKDMGQRTDVPSCKAYIRVVGSSEHIEIHLPLSSIPRLVSELEKLHQNMEHFDAEGRAHAERVRQYNQAKEAYETKRDRALENVLSAGKYTGDQVERKIDEIPF